MLHIFNSPGDQGKHKYRFVVVSTLAAAALLAQTRNADAERFVPVVGATVTTVGTSSTCTASATACEKGAFSTPFAEPTILGQPTSEKCIPTASGMKACKPAAGTLVALYDERFLYFNALEGTENVELSVIAEFGQVSVNDQSRVLAFGPGDAPSWTKPAPVDGTGPSDGGTPTAILPGIIPITSGPGNDGALFCSDVAQLADGSILAAGGTDYYNEPGVDPLPYGVVEIEGLKNTRVFDPKTNTWWKTGDMHYGRWYPSLLTLSDGKLLVTSGVTKLIKPVYPQELKQSGRNVVQTETFDVACGKWTENPPSAQRSFPLFPRLHLLPNGRGLYNAGGQDFNPNGFAYDQALWNIVAAYDPGTQSWTDLAIAGLPLELNQFGADQIASALNPTNPMTAAALESMLAGMIGTTISDPAQLATQVSGLLGYAVDPRLIEKAIGSGFRGSTFSVMLPLKPDANGNYTKVEVLTAGGVPSGYAMPSPGTYFATDISRIDTINLAGGGMAYKSRLTGKLNKPRWYGSAVLLPDGSVMTVSGGDRDGVVTPGMEIPVKQAERFDPRTQTWTPMALPSQARTYHNTAVLMADGRVLVAGHSPISTGYFNTTDLSAIGFSPGGARDPSFEIYSPPYIFRNDRPVIRNVPDEPVDVQRGQLLTVKTNDASSIESVVLVRRTATTHLIDGDQRMVVLPIVGRNSEGLNVRIPANSAVLPGGHYMLFINRGTADGPIPSTSMPVKVAANIGPCQADN